MTVLHQYVEEVPMEIVSRARQIMTSLLNKPENLIDDVFYKTNGEERWCIEEAEESAMPLDAYALVRFWCEKDESTKIKRHLTKMKNRYYVKLVA